MASSQDLADALAANSPEKINAAMLALFPHAERLLPLGISRQQTAESWCAGNQVDVAHEDGSAFLTLRNATWVPGWDYVFTEDATVLSDTGYLSIACPMNARPHVPINKDHVLHYWPTEATLVKGDVLLLSAPINWHFGHWMVDFLPRLIGLQKLNPAAKIATVAQPPAKILETILAAGVTEDRLLYCDDGRRYQFETLSLYMTGGYIPPRPRLVNFTRKIFGRPTAPNPAKRIFLSRGKVTTRLIANEAEFNLFLERNGFQTFDPGEMSLAQEQELFADAGVMLGAFGSNLFSLYSAPAGAKVICLVYPGRGDPTIAKTSAILGMDCEVIHCDRARGEKLKRAKEDSDIFVDIARLEAAIAGSDA